MRTRNLNLTPLAWFTASAILSSLALAQGVDVKSVRETRAPLATASHAQIQVPNRPSTAHFQGQQGKQKTEISFDPASQLVTVKMLVQDSSGYFIPNIRRDNFVVYENGVRQHNATVEIEHAPVSLAVLMEWGGRYQALSNALADQVPRAARQVLDELGRQDRIAIFRYGDKVDRLADFSSGHEALDGLFIGLNRPEFSELNFYDALTSTLNFMKPASGRKAVILISSGLDTFSRSKYEDVLNTARDSGTPIYVINLGSKLRESVEYSAKGGPYARLEWKRAEHDLEEIARSSGGRVYSPASIFELSGVYDDILENLRVRYVITYKSNAGLDPSTARTVRVELVDSRTGGPLEIVDADGKPVHSQISVGGSYLPRSASAASVNTTSQVQQE